MLYHQCDWIPGETGRLFQEIAVSERKKEEGGYGSFQNEGD